MLIQRRKCKLANSKYRDVDLRDYEKIIIETINNTVPGKNPKVYRKYFYTDTLTQSEAVSIGRALARVECLKAMGKTVTTFRLFDGKVCDVEVSEDKNEKQTRGGRMK